uniref:hypothetical protein n=1 Tax=Thaumasiovibrio occultus TaxID=1891184 RepID=UPI000B360D38|nr:hypothetical protein [Thaumasiovibrio occultus]
MVHRIGITLFLLVFSASLFALPADSAIRFGGWSHHLEDEWVDDGPRYNESHGGIGVDIGLKRWQRWQMQLSLHYMKDSWNQDLYAASLSFDRPVELGVDKLVFAWGATFGVQSRSVLEDVDLQFVGLERKVLPLVAPYLRVGYDRVYMLMTVAPQFRKVTLNGNSRFEMNKPFFFWQLGISF